MNLSPVVLSIPIYFILIGVELLVERFQKTSRYRLNDAVTNISCGIGEQVTGVFLKVFTVAIYELVYTHFAFFQIPMNVYTLIVLFFLYDFCYYWAHRISHEVNLFWSGHVVHHQSEDYNLSVALRQSWFQKVFTFYIYLPLALMGFDTESLVYVSGLNLLYQFWIHTEAINKLGFLEIFMNTPSHHRVHHGRNPKYIDKNYAGVFIIWDKMFNTFEPEDEKVVYGITTPVNSWNPLWANFSHFQTIGKQLSEAHTLIDKFKILFYKPGWSAKLQGYMAIPEVRPETTQKYDIQAAVAINWYVFVQYLLTLGAVALFLFKQQHLDLPYKVGAAVLIAWSIWNNGGLFEHKNWIFRLEFLRTLLTPFLLLAYFYQQNAGNLPLWAWLSAAVFGFASWLWLWFCRKIA